jgi:hypothetical protein
MFVRRLRALGPAILEDGIEGKRIRTKCQKREPDPKRQRLFHGSVAKL